MSYGMYSMGGIDYLPISDTCPVCGHFLVKIHGGRYAGTGEYGDVYMQPVKCGVVGMEVRGNKLAGPVHCSNACQSEFEMYDTRVGEFTV